MGELRKNLKSSLNFHLLKVVLCGVGRHLARVVVDDLLRVANVEFFENLFRVLLDGALVQVVVAHDLGDDEEGKDAALVAVSSVDEVEVLLEVTTLEGLLRLQRQQLVAPDGHEEGVGDEVVRRGGLQLLHVDLLDALHQLADVLLRAVDLGAEDGRLLQRSLL